MSVQYTYDPQDSITGSLSWSGTYLPNTQSSFGTYSYPFNLGAFSAVLNQIFGSQTNIHQLNPAWTAVFSIQSQVNSPWYAVEGYM